MRPDPSPLPGLATDAELAVGRPVVRCALCGYPLTSPVPSADPPYDAGQFGSVADRLRTYNFQVIDKDISPPNPMAGPRPETPESSDASRVGAVGEAGGVVSIVSETGALQALRLPEPSSVTASRA